MFQFKQFAVDQSGCAMKINTDGVLLGAMAGAGHPKQILDIGTGTGVIALMLAQRFTEAVIDAVEIDKQAAATAAKNFAQSPFANRLAAYHADFVDHLQANPVTKYDLIVSNPPFYTASLKSPGKEKAIAKHADDDLFETLVALSAKQLTDEGSLWLILPAEISGMLQEIAEKVGLNLFSVIHIRSYPESVPHRHILAFTNSPGRVEVIDFVIYNAPKVYSAQYSELLKPFFTIF